MKIRPGKYGQWVGSTLEQLDGGCLSAPREPRPVLVRSCVQKFVKLYGLECTVLFESKKTNEVELLPIRNQVVRTVKPSCFVKC